MTSLWVPAPTPAQVLTDHLPDSPFHQLLGFTRGMLPNTRDIPAAERRAPALLWRDLPLGSVRPFLPLRLVVAPTQPAPAQTTPRHRRSVRPRCCRSYYSSSAG